MNRPRRTAELPCRVCGGIVAREGTGGAGRCRKCNTVYSELPSPRQPAMRGDRMRVIEPPDTSATAYRRGWERRRLRRAPERALA